jgi:hypothetical protein
MFKLYTDKNNTFKCKVLVEGANDSTALARLVIEGETHNLMFDGYIKEGLCEVTIGKFKNFDNFKSKGNIKLEVIADDTYFIPWKSEYKLEQSKVVTVEMIEEKSSKPLVEVTEISYTNSVPKVSSNSNGEKLYNLLVKENIDISRYGNISNLLRYNDKAKKIIKGYLNKNKISGPLLESTLKYLSDKV